MQEISVILAHPYGGSLNAAIAQTVAATLRSNGYQVNFHDLDQEKFNPVMSAEELAGDHTNDNLQAALVFNTSNTPEERENTVFGDPLERIWKDCVFDFCGITSFKRLMFRVVADSTEQERQSWLAQTAETVSRYFPPISANITQGN